MPEGPFNPGKTFFGPLPVRGADVDSFEVLNALYARDAGRVYYRCGKVPKADPGSFRVLDPGFYVDPNEDYADGQPGAPARQFRGYARDHRAVFHYVDTIGQPSEVRGADLETFEVLDWGFARDRSRVYHERNPLKGASPEAFVQLSVFFSTTESAIYYLDRLLIGADPSTFRVVRGQLARDARCVYLYDRIVLGADPATYQMVGHTSIGKDGARVFANGEPIPGADPETFERVGGLYHRDRDRVYFAGKPVPKARPGSFRYIREHWGEDDHRVYRSGYPSRRIE